MELQSWRGERDRHNASSISIHLSSLEIPITPALFSVAVYVSPVTDLSRNTNTEQQNVYCTQPRYRMAPNVPARSSPGFMKLVG